MAVPKLHAQSVITAYRVFAARKDFGEPFPRKGGGDDIHQ